MGKSSIIMRRSIFTFLQNFHHFSAAPALLLLPFAAATLLSHPLISSSYLFPITHGRLSSVFLAAGFPPSSQLFSILNLKLSQTILSSLFVAPFTLSFLLLAKAAVIATLHHPNQRKNPFFSRTCNTITIFNRLFVTQICNSLVVVSANATCFSLIVISFNISDVVLGGRLSSRPGCILLLSATGAVLYAVVLANTYIVCNLALILSALEETKNRRRICGCGFNSILKACFVIKRRGGIALSLAVPVNMALTAVEALFQYRVVRAYYYRGGGDHVAAAVDDALVSVVVEAVVIAYLYAVLVVLDTIVGFVFLESCESNRRRGIDMEGGDEEGCFGKVEELELVL